MRRIRAEGLVAFVLIAAFACGTLWLLNRTRANPEKYYLPLTTYSPQPDGAKALYELLERTGRKPQRYHGTEYHYPAGACMVVLIGGRSGIGAALTGSLDPKALRLWLEAGGRLVLCSEPGELDDPVTGLIEELGLPSLGAYEAPASQVALKAGAGKQGHIAPDSRLDANGSVYSLPSLRPVLWTGVKQIEVAPVDYMDKPAAAVLLATADAPGGDPMPVALWRSVGKGELMWVTRPELASNGWIARADNAELVLALLDYAANGREFYFDEHLHGYSSLSPNILALLLRTGGGRLLLALAGLSLLLFAGAAVRPARFTVETVPQRRQSTEMVLAQADLFRRAGARHVIADSQVDGLRRAYMQALHLSHPPSDAELLQWVASEPADEGLAVLTEYLRSRMLSRTSHSLLALAQACDKLKMQLQGQA